MNLEPVIQSEVSQKDKNKYCINTYIWRKWFWWTYFQGRNRDTDVENGPVDTVGEREGGWNRENNIDIFSLSFSKVAQLCPTHCNPIDYTVHGVLQARILEWVAFPFSRGSSQARDWTQVSCIAGRFFTSWATREAQEYWSGEPIPSSADLPDPGNEPGSPA